MSPRLYWRRLVAACRRERARRVRRAVGRLDGRSRLAADLLETLSPMVLFESGHLRRRQIYRRRVAYVRPRQARL